MAIHTLNRPWGLGFLAILLAFLPQATSAHDLTTTDPDDSTGRLDISAVEVTHSGRESTSTLTFSFSFFEAHRFGSTDGLRVNLNTFKGEKRDRYLLVRSNPDGSLYAELNNASGGTIGYGRAWAPHPSQLVLEVRLRQLSRSELPTRAHWSAVTLYTADECSDPGDVAHLCYDITPEPPQRQNRHVL